MCRALPFSALMVAACGTPGPAATPREPDLPAAWPPVAVDRVEPERLDTAPELPEWAAGLGMLPWVVRDEPDRPEQRLAIFWNPSCPDDEGGSGWTFAVGAAEVAWEALECVDAMAVVDVEGDGALDVAAASWEEACPDPVAPGGAAPACLLLSVWPAAQGMPQAYRLEASGDGATATGVARIDRLASLLSAPPCPAMDLRGWSAERVEGLTAAGIAGERIDGIRCVAHPLRAAAAGIPVVALLDGERDGRIVPASYVTLAREGDAWADGYEPLADVDGDGVSDWLWISRDESGDRMTVTRGPGRGRTLASFATDARGSLLDRRVVAPPGGRAALDSWEVVPGTNAASGRVRLHVAIERSAGPGETISLELPLVAPASPSGH